MPVILFILGAAVGAYGTLIGAGGGFVLMPVLLFLYPAGNVAGLTSLSLAVVALNALSGAIAYARRKRIDYRLALVVAATSVPGTMLGALLTPYIPRALFEVVFGLMLLSLAALVLARPPVPRSTKAGPVETMAPAVYARMRLGVTLSGAFGGLAGVLGIGGAPPLVVVLTHVMQVPVWRAMPTVQSVVLLSATAAACVHLITGEFKAGIAELAPLGGGALVGAQLGAALAERLSSGALVRLLAVALLAVGLTLIGKALR